MLLTRRPLIFNIVRNDEKTDLNNLRKYEQRFINKILTDVATKCKRALCIEHNEAETVIRFHWINGRIKITLFCCCSQGKRILENTFSSYTVPVNVQLMSGEDEIS